ncbi:flagellar biosynthesis protein FlhB [Rhodobacteraceae bacterium SC52]|nr:flagellar biosynthesis protein FlhB [Rhodobacteraceae bacterium SC52]
MSEGQDDDSEKPYEPSQKRLDDARKKGEVPRSTDLMTSASYAGLVLTIMVFGAGSVTELGGAMLVMLDQAETMSGLLLADGGATLAGGLMAKIGITLAPWFLVPATLVLLSVIAQRGFTMTGSKLAPKMNRISLLSNAKQKFGRGGLFEFAKSFTKLVVFSVTLALFLIAEIPDMVATALLGPGPVVTMLTSICLRFLAVVLAVSLAIGAVDFLWQQAEHLRKHRMSHKEMTDEAKQTEGDPHMKQKRRQRGYDIATNRMMADVPTADVIVVNPVHYAVALKWSREPGSAPVCVAKGVDEVAARIREVATEAAIPIHRDPPAARALHATVEVGHEIRADHYQAVAAAIRFADQMRRKQGDRA